MPRPELREKGAPALWSSVDREWLCADGSVRRDVEFLREAQLLTTWNLKTRLCVSKRWCGEKPGAVRAT